jgi:succinate-semialdehyde dehydrogenase/glutarate-semialdehyde dehydrogenase
MTVDAQIDIVRGHVSVDPIILVDVPEDCSAVQEETFGPVVVINTVADIDDAVRRVNGTAFGLGSSVYSARHGSAIASRLRAALRLRYGRSFH